VEWLISVINEPCCESVAGVPRKGAAPASSNQRPNKCSAGAGCKLSGYRAFEFFVSSNPAQISGAPPPTLFNDAATE
jgi:hypothetical protein